MILTGHDPYTFPSPDAFLPKRWEGMSELEVLTFGHGPRACVGRRFAHVEALCYLSLLLRDWKLDVVLNEGESRSECMQRILDSCGRIGLSFGIGPLDLKFSKRTM